MESITKELERLILRKAKEYGEEIRTTLNEVESAIKELDLMKALDIIQETKDYY